MRSVLVCGALLVFCGLAFGQATVIGGTASNWAPSYGVYAAPYVPLVTTPEVTLSTVSPGSAGASSSAFGLVAGATNSTLSSEFIGEPPSGPYTEPVWYGPSNEFAGAYPPPAPHGMYPHREGQRERAFDFIAESRESRESVALLKGEAGAPRKAARTYTNSDVERMNQNNGFVKYDGKTEHI